MKAHFVTFYSPGTLFAEHTTKPIRSWDVDVAKTMARKIKERHGALPYAFQFTTRGRGAGDLDSKVVKTSPLYYLGGVVETLKQVEARNKRDGSLDILVANMRGNRWKRIITNTNSWRWTQPLEDTDVVLEWTK